MTTKCAGMNCQSTDGTNHSPECRAEHAAAVAGGRFVKGADEPIYQVQVRGSDKWDDASKDAFDHMRAKSAIFATRIVYTTPPSPTLSTETVDKGVDMTDEQINDIARKYFSEKQPPATITLYQCREFARALLAASDSADKEQP